MEIKNLPNEVLLLIFENMNIQDLLDASQVCVRWRELIKCSKSLWNHINLNLDSDDDQLDLCVLFFRWLKLAPALNELTISHDSLYFMEPVLMCFDKGDHTECISPKTITIRRLCIKAKVTDDDIIKVPQSLFSRINGKWEVKLVCECETVDFANRIDDHDQREIINFFNDWEISLRLKCTVTPIEITKIRIENKEIEYCEELEAMNQIVMETEKSEMDTNRRQLHPFVAWSKISPEILDKVNFDKEEIDLKNSDVDVNELEGAVKELRNSGKLDKKMKAIQLVIDMCRMDIEDSKKKINKLKALRSQIQKTVLKTKTCLNAYFDCNEKVE